MLEGSTVLQNIVDLILDPLILLIFSFGLLVFLWGLLEFIRSGANPQKHKEGTEHMIWGVLGMFIMVAFWGIIMLIANTFGFEVPSADDISGTAADTSTDFYRAPGSGD